MPSVSASLTALVQNLVPESRNDERLASELTALCQEVLNSHIGQTRESDVGHLAELVKRHLQQTSPSGVSALRFTNLLSRLLEQPVLSRKHASILFLHSLGSSQHSASASSAFLPSLAPPPPNRPLPPATISKDLPAVSNKQSGKPKAQLLREYRAKIGRPHLAEALLLRDALYILQGISGKHVLLSDKRDSSEDRNLIFRDDPLHIISASNRTLIHRLAELGHLYTRVATFVQEREGKSGVGMIEQSLCFYLQSQLTEYFRLIAILESQMVATSNSEGADDAGQNPRDEETGLTLKRLEVWIDEWRLRLRMMSVCVEGCRDSHGGALVNLIHSYTENGDPFVRKFTDELLEEVSKPFFATLHTWLFSGELHDPFSEFFVALDSEVAQMQHHPIANGGGLLSGDGGFGGGSGDGDDLSGEKEGGLLLWERKYEFRKEMLPTFVGEPFGRKIFSTGKSLNFIRYSCHDSDWVATREKMSNTGGILQYSDIAGLERSIDAAYSVASQRLFDVFFDKFRLLDHLKALKHYLMLGHGDFADQLMEALGPSMSKPANTLYRHNLTATLETAIRSSNAQHDPPDVLRRLDARMLEYSHGEIGWDVFTLEYKVDAPIDTVLDPDGMIKYLKLFSHLWKMKRIELALSQAWMKIAGGARNFLRVPALTYDWHKVRIVMAEMIHFMRQIQAYCQLEVIECSWQSLLDFIHKKEGDLDALMQAHRNYLDRMVKKVLLLSPKAGREENLLNQVRELFQIILQFRDATDRFYDYSLAEAAMLDSEKDYGRGVYTSAAPTSERSKSSADTLAQIRQNMEEYGTSFSERAQTIVHSLQTHPDLDCRFLGIRLSFSDFYKSKRDLQQQKA
ncbi:gamma-tubulin complex DGRIP91/SPC98 component [Rickenella mellea]|uniref:Gamma-tubulin complex DGRIP91/SPC98 component n=1 Tax=Rickenella mellea TaxID=50990 RepID=A0A4R5XDR7_9AGAM|nr:gamma-tubulin complex DGRIP91/SPC98 component [Rickenella mellea]